jgi:hypothetical protein
MVFYYTLFLCVPPIVRTMIQSPYRPLYHDTVTVPTIVPLYHDTVTVPPIIRTIVPLYHDTVTVPPIIRTIVPWFSHNNVLSVHLKLIWFILWSCDYIQCWNGSDTCVAVIALLFVPPWRWPCKWQKNVGVYLVIKYIKILLCICLYSYCMDLLVVFVLWIYATFWLYTIIYLDFYSFTHEPANWLASYNVHVIPLCDEVIPSQFCVLSPNCGVIQYRAKCLSEGGDKWITHSPCEVGKKENECETVCIFFCFSSDITVHWFLYR